MGSEEIDVLKCLNTSTVVFQLIDLIGREVKSCPEVIMLGIRRLSTW